MRLTPAAYARARDFLLAQARPLERALFRFHFDNAPAVDVREALAPFQNADGGFGNALEADFRLPDSSAIATCLAFKHFRTIRLDARDRMVQRAVRWTQAAFDRALSRWPMVPPEVDKYPHAPWWAWQPPGPAGFAPNPGAEFVGHLWRFREAVDPAFLSDITDLAERYVDALPEEPEMHDLMCLIHFAETPSVPAALRNRTADRIRHTGPAIVTPDPAAWSGYAVKPLMLAPRADSLLAPLFPDLLARNLDYEIAQQNQDGSWSPNWNWFGLFPEEWPAAEKEWKGVLTLQILLSLRSHDRFPATAV